MEIKKKCCDCGIEKSLGAFHKCFSGRLTGNKAGYDERNPLGCVKNRCKTCYSARERARYFLDFYDAMGGKCECCGEAEPRFLTLDHRNSDGNEHRKNGTQCSQIYRLARNEGFPKTKYALLCYNCNSGRAHRGTDGICPHRSSESAEQYIARLRDRIKIVGAKFRTPEKGPRPWKSKEMLGNKFAQGKKGKGGRRTLNEEKVAMIRALKGIKTRVEVAKEFGVGWKQVYKIWAGIAWKDVTRDA